MLKRYTGYKRLLALAALSSGAAPVERTAIGNPLTFVTDLARPLKTLLIPFTPQQEGTGDPSPENIRSILPWNGLTVWAGGKNLFNKNAKDTNKGYVQGWYLLNTGSIDDSTSWYISEYISVVGGSKLSITNPSNGSNQSVCFYDSEKQFVSGQKYNSNSVVKVTVPTTAKFMRVSVNVNYVDVFQIEVGENITEYEPYKPITDTDIVFPSTVYGGTLDVVTGKLWKTINFITFDETSNWKKSDDVAGMHRFYIPLSGSKYGQGLSTIKACNLFKPVAQGQYSEDNVIQISRYDPNCYIITSNYSTLDELKALLAETPIQIAYELATPQEIQLTQAQITALVGDNTIWSDADGNMTAVYLVSAAYADSHPVGGLGSGLLGGGFGSGSGEPDEPDEPGDHDQPDEPAEPDQPGDE